MPDEPVKAPDAGQPAVPPKPPRLFRNTLSMAGIVLSVIVFSNIVFLVLMDILAEHPNPYVGILAYLILPAVLFLTLLIIPAGMLWERRRRARMAPGEIPRYPRIDFNKPHHRKVFMVFSVVTVAFLFLSAGTSYQAYEYTDSVQFCGQTCHSVMHPEYTAYQDSPHARVTCAQCHVGPGATWYVRSKMSGLYQVYAVTFKKYPRPIPTPVHSLRPAQDTCEQCHWPEKFHGAQLKVLNHFASDENNTPREIQLLIRTGGGSPMAGPVAGIHWHMNIANEVTYIAGDDHRQVIPWVQMKDRQGRVRQFKSSDSDLTPEQIAAASKRKMDCVDCHNRPSHIYTPPDRAVNESMLIGRIDPSLPWIKKVSVAALTADYGSTQEALEGIATSMNRFYLKEQPQVFEKRRAAIQDAISETQRIYRTNIFPEMKVDWRTHPDNIGHFYFPGCFRCHDGKHVSAEGELIRNECAICHTTLAQKEAGKPLKIENETFQHPVDMGDMRDFPCADCHTGGIGP